MLAGMAGAAGPELAAAVSNAGGLGNIGALAKLVLDVRCFKKFHSAWWCFIIMIIFALYAFVLFSAIFLSPPSCIPFRPHCRRLFFSFASFYLYLVLSFFPFFSFLCFILSFSILILFSSPSPPLDLALPFGGSKKMDPQDHPVAQVASDLRLTLCEKPLECWRRPRGPSFKNQVLHGLANSIGFTHVAPNSTGVIFADKTDVRTWWTRTHLLEWTCCSLRWAEGLGRPTRTTPPERCPNWSTSSSKRRPGRSSWKKNSEREREFVAFWYSWIVCIVFCSGFICWFRWKTETKMVQIWWEWHCPVSALLWPSWFSSRRPYLFAQWVSHPNGPWTSFTVPGFQLLGWKELGG